MQQITTEELKKLGYKIENAKITGVDLSMSDNGQLVLKMCLEGYGWGAIFGDFTIGFGEVDIEEFRDCEQGAELLMRTIDTVGVPTFSEMNNKVVRVALEGKSVRGIGNAIYDKWCVPILMWKK